MQNAMQQKQAKTDDILKVNFQECLTLLTINWNIRRSMLIVGPPATAKTASVYHFADLNNFKTITTTGPTCIPTDPKGMPVSYEKDGKQLADYIPYGDLRQAIEAIEPTVWIFDDFTNADKDVQKGLMQLIHERRVGSHKISDYVLIVATGNRREDKSGVSGVLEAVKTRFCSVVQIEPTVDDYLQSYAIPNNIHDDVVGFIRFQPDKLYIHNPTNDMNREPNLRMWEYLSDALHELDDMQADPTTTSLLVKSVAGVSLGNDIAAYIDLKSELPDIDDCLENPETCRIPDESSVSVIFAFNAAVARRCTPTNIHRILAIVDRMPKIYGSKLAFDAIAHCPEAEETSVYMSWAGRNKDNFM